MEKTIVDCLKIVPRVCDEQKEAELSFSYEDDYGKNNDVLFIKCI
jgi:hypothetical protein